MGCESLWRQVSQSRPQQVNEWRIGGRRVWLEALALEVQEAKPFRVRTGRRNQPRLADPSLASEQNGLPAPSPYLVERPLQRRDLVITADHDGADDRFVVRHGHRYTCNYRVGRIELGGRQTLERDAGQCDAAAGMDSLDSLRQRMIPQEL
jgi:hypothetical protein